jgi:hypothetical protein
MIEWSLAVPGGRRRRAMIQSAMRALLYAVGGFGYGVVLV